MQTAADYRRVVYGRSARSRSSLPPAELVWAGAEPKEFTNLFPVWRHDEHVHELNKKVRDLEEHKKCCKIEAS